MIENQTQLTADEQHMAETFGNKDVPTSNPKDAVGVRKVAFSVLPWRVLHRVALAMLEGALKYGRHNYRAAGARASVYFDAVVARHLSDWWEGTDIDPDSGLHHIDKAIAGLMVLRDSMLQGNFIDDRPMLGPDDALDFEKLNKLAASLHDKHADKSPRHYTIKDSAKDEQDKASSASRVGLLAKQAALQALSKQLGFDRAAFGNAQSPKYGDTFPALNAPVAESANFDHVPLDSPANK
ncbi:MAG: hypothetical protein IPO08_22960 [Xanthomonadales bacterium]|nr:hypothetical protein [Xanthomonadales bacterium]